MSDSALPVPVPDYTSLAQMAVLSLPSPSSRRNYAREIRLFLASGRPLNREGVQAHLISLRDAGKGQVGRNIALAAIRLLAREANVRGLLPDQDMSAIERVKGERVKGERAGNWLNVREVERLLDAARLGPLGVRDQAIIACLVGCGLRRAEVAGLEWSQWQQREGRTVLVDVNGKGQRIRSVPVPRWAERYIERWKDESGDKGRIFSVSPDCVLQRVRRAALIAGMEQVRPHDLRRTTAKLMLKGGAPIEQISATLGHESIETTQRYLGLRLELREGQAAVDRMGIDEQGAGERVEKRERKERQEYE